MRRKPTPPFTTSTLQQEASRRLGLGIKRTMAIAQALYEGVDLGAGAEGLITYMRTDSTALSKDAVRAARREIAGAFGKRYLPAKPRSFRSRARNAREAHEAIRPTDLARTPESLTGRLDGDAERLYALIRNRTLASQMAEARFERVEAALASADGAIVLETTGSRLAFDGFLRVYREGADEDGAPGTTAADDERDRPLPALAEGEPVRIRAVRMERRRTSPPARFTEAGLVRRLEELGIGRPSTWAAIVGVLRNRQYVAMAGGRFVPLERGRVATAFLERFFGAWVEYGYTADLEVGLDRVAGGALAWKGLLGGFWDGFNPALEAVGELGRRVVVAALEDALADFLYGPLHDSGDAALRRHCPACGTGELGLKASRHGLFVGCLDWPACGYRRRLAAAGEDYTAPKPLGTEPGSGVPVTLRHGPHGWYVQKGEHAGKAKPRRMSVPGGMAVEEMTLDAALEHVHRIRVRSRAGSEHHVFRAHRQFERQCEHPAKHRLRRRGLRRCRRLEHRQQQQVQVPYFYQRIRLALLCTLQED